MSRCAAAITLAIALMCATLCLADDARPPAAESLPRFPELKLIIVVPESTGASSTKESTAETALIQLFTEAGYKVIAQERYAALRNDPRVRQMAEDPDSESARMLIADQGADLLILGHAIADSNGTAEGGAASARAHIVLRAVPMHGDGTLLAAMDTTASGADPSPLIARQIALRKVADRAGRYLMERIGPLVGGPKAPRETKMDTLAADLGRKPRIGVARFKDRSQWAMADWDLGMQVPHLIANELMKSGQFEVVELNNIDDVKSLQVDTKSGMYEEEAQAPDLGTLAKPDYIIIGRITQFGTKKTGGLGGLGVFGGLLGAGLERAQVKLLLEIVDAKTGVVKVSGEAGDDASAAFVAGGYAGIGIGTFSFDKTALGRALHGAVVKATSLVLNTFSAAAVCPRCGAQVRPGAKFCPTCGVRLEVAPQTCPRCHEPIQPNDKFCEHCGAKL